MASDFLTPHCGVSGSLATQWKVVLFYQIPVNHKQGAVQIDNLKVLGNDAAMTFYAHKPPTYIPQERPLRIKTHSGSAAVRRHGQAAAAALSKSR